WSNEFSGAIPPTYTPFTWTMGVAPFAPVSSKQFDQISSGPCGAHPCQALSTEAALLHGQRNVNSESVETGCTRKVNEVTAPRLPPPPPRNAQKRSESWLVSQVRMRPSASTTWAESRLSQVR